MISPNPSLASPREVKDSTPRVISVPSGLIVEWHAPPVQMNFDPDGRTVVSIPGYTQTSQPGAPVLPFSAVLVALPRGANPRLEILSSAEETRQLKAPLALADRPNGTLHSPDGQVIGGAFSAAPDETVQNLQPVMLEPLGILRGVQLARLTFYPALPAGDDLRLTTHLKVKVDFNTVIQTAGTALPVSDPLISTLNSAVVNPQHLQAAPLPIQASGAQQVAGSSVAAVEVSQTGIVSIPYEDLAGIGFDISSTNLPYLSRDGQAIAYQLHGGDDDSIFEPGEEIRFFANPRFSRWTAGDVYFLSNNTDAGILMSARSANPGSLPEGTPWVEALFEDNTIYTPECYCAPIPAGRDGDRWVWDRLQLPSPSAGTYTFQLAGVDQSKNAELIIWLIGFTDLLADPDHQIDVALNGHDIGSRQWDGKHLFQADFLNIPGSWLIDGQNTLTISLPGMPGVPVDGVWLDAFAVRHARSANEGIGQSLGFSGESGQNVYKVSLASTAVLKAYDVSDPDQPEDLFGLQLAGDAVSFADPDAQLHDYWLTTSSAIQSPEKLRMVTQSRLGQDFNGAQYLIISPAEFIPSLADLIELRKSNGYSVAVEDLQAIYDAYGGGIPQPAAIRSFLEQAYFNWNIRPIYVLLVGDGTSDPRGYLEDSSETIMPPFLADVDPWAGETASDNRYVTVDGDDILPDMLIGRLPANNTSQLETMISKIVLYEQQHSPSLWQHRAVFVADNADTGGNFPFLSENLIDKFPSRPFSAQRLYYSPSKVTPEDFRQQVKDMWDEGNGLIMFTGHSSIHQWAHEIFFHLNDIPSLENGHKLPVALEMTCFTGSFQVPGFETLDENLLRHPGGGVIAAWGSTGLGIATGHQWLAEGFLNSVYKDGTGELGLATLAGKINLAGIGAYSDLIDTFTLLGDPATKLERSYITYLPITQN
jgi:hypothetical protein